MIIKTYSIVELSKMTGAPKSRIRNAFRRGLIPNESGCRKYEATIDSYNQYAKELQAERKAPFGAKV